MCPPAQSVSLSTVTLEQLGLGPAGLRQWPMHVDADAGGRKKLPLGAGRAANGQQLAALPASSSGGGAGAAAGGQREGGQASAAQPPQQQHGDMDMTSGTLFIEGAGACVACGSDLAVERTAQRVLWEAL